MNILARELVDENEKKINFLIRIYWQIIQNKCQLIDIGKKLNSFICTCIFKQNKLKELEKIN